jgi:hypothetical protein
LGDAHACAEQRIALAIGQLATDQFCSSFISIEA